MATLLDVKEVRRRFKTTSPELQVDLTAPGVEDPLQLYLDAADQAITSRYGPHGTPQLLFERHLTIQGLFLSDGELWYPCQGRPADTIDSVTLDGVALTMDDYFQGTDRRKFTLREPVAGRLQVVYRPLDDDDARKDVFLRLVRLSARDTGVQYTKLGGGVIEVRQNTEVERLAILRRLDYRRGPPIMGEAHGD